MIPAMKELLREPDPARMGLMQSILETRGIETWIRNQHEHSSFGIAHLGPPRLEPVLCVTHEKDHSRALEILHEHLVDEEVKSREEIPCAACGEPNPGNFEICWSCGGEVRAHGEGEKGRGGE